MVKGKPVVARGKPVSVTFTFENCEEISVPIRLVSGRGYGISINGFDIFDVFDERDGRFSVDGISMTFNREFKDLKYEARGGNQAWALDRFSQRDVTQVSLVYDAPRSPVTFIVPWTGDDNQTNEAMSISIDESTDGKITLTIGGEHGEE